MPANKSNKAVKSTEPQAAEVVDMKDAMAKKGKRAKEGETARDRFLRLAAPRVEVALKRVRLLGNLARSGYEYEPAEVNQMIEALEEAVTDVKSQFTARLGGGSAKKGFSFKKR